MPDDVMHLPCTGPLVAGSDGAARTLFDLPRGVTARVERIDARGDASARELALRLLEIGFVPGETIRVIAHGHPGHEPVAVRIGGTTFALRRFEAERVIVARDFTAP